jgi:TetR/AcrR family transcriptional regulator
MNGSGGKKHHSSMNCFCLKRQLWRDSTMNRNGLPRKAVRNGSLTRMKIIETASAEFVEKGYAGARVDEIVKKANISKNLLYHHFGSKEKLFIQVLEHNYTQLRAHQMDIHIQGMSPVDGMRNLINATFQYFVDHPEIISLLNTENLHKAIHIKQSERILSMYHPVIALIKELLWHGTKDGIFRTGVDAVDLYISIVALVYYYMSNRYTLSSIFNIDLTEIARLKQRNNHIVDMIITYLTSPADPPISKEYSESSR